MHDHFAAHPEDLRPAADLAPVSLSETPAADPFASLKGQLRQDKFIRLMFDLETRHQGTHLKLLVADELSVTRRLRLGSRQVWNFGSDSFLGLDRDRRVQQAIADALPTWGTHNGASRAFSSVALLGEAERRLARWLGVPDTLIFPSVTLANHGLLPALAVPDTALVIDRFAHTSVQEGAALAAAGRGVCRRELHPCTAEALHRLLAAEPPGHVVVATDGVYSMAGTSPPLADLERTARAHGGTLYVDDAHGTGVCGPRGRGAAAAALASLRSSLVVGSLSKAFSCLGAFVTCDPELKLYLQMRASTVIFGGPVPPPYLAAILAACDIIDSPEGDALRGRLHRLTGRLTAGLRALGLVVEGGGDIPIVSVRVGPIAHVLNAGRWLFDHGFYVQAAHYPAVSPRGSLLRIQVNANHPEEALDGLLNAFTDLRRAIALPSASPPAA